MTRFICSLRDVMDEEDLLADLLTFDERQDLLFEFDIAEEDDVNGTAGAAGMAENAAVIYEWMPTRTESDASVTVTVEGNVRLPPPQQALGGGCCALLQSPALVRDAMRSFGTGGSGVGPPLRAGLLVGDSFARRAGFLPRVGEWEVTVWVPSAQVGKTWAGCVRSGALARKVEEWSKAARRRGLQPSEVAVWLEGNDVYPLGATPDRLDGAVWRQFKTTVTSLARDIAPVILLGPTPRPRRDAPLLWARRGAEGSPPRAALVGEGEAQWEATAAFNHLDRPVTRWLGEPLESDMRIKRVSVGRCVLERRRQGRKVSAYVLSRAALLHYDDDGVHLSPAGYARVAAKAGWPAWLQLAEA
ncbi:hypothetical protein FJT64_024157 [Amphibalanus amphitrite]|uniref:Uncharacterized protein n=1 Tax=Amphibalanus amphitrite TaxID=1232801 RepID=A0A6A4WD31_AMPAM|nr:hypothetical protein FJT64_024157 [Amphibalanus amphitrite]